jgi:hypothetical protein
MSQRRVIVVVFRWWSEMTIKAFSDRAPAEAFLARCPRRRDPFGDRYEHAQGDLTDWLIEIPDQATQSLWAVCVRRRHPTDHAIYCEHSEGLEDVFASREEAEASQAELEQKAAESGDHAPLMDFGYLEAMLEFSDFDLTVFGDWLTDHGIMTLPDPAQYQRGWARWLASLTREQLADLYAALHRFRFYEVVEVPFIVGDYPRGQWDEWEKRPTAPAAESFESDLE